MGTYVYIKYNNLYIMAVTQRNSNAAMILLFLYRLVEVLKEYFRELEEESIRDNFVITYELMDEMMDFGYPQISEAKILREYITQEAHKLEVVKPPMAVTNAVSWRSEGLASCPSLPNHTHASPFIYSLTAFHTDATPSPPL